MVTQNTVSQRYAVTPHPVETILSWVKSGDIAIPEIQRPFVWDASKVRDLLDSLYRGFPVGYLISWRNPTVKLKDGTSSAGRRILIDGQQRVTALMASLLGHQVMTKDYEATIIKIAFHVAEERFEVANPAISKDSAWLQNVAELFAPEASAFDTLTTYMERNPTADRKQAERAIGKLLKIVNNQVGVIELAEDLDIETVTEIFIRVNSAGVSLSQADFAMSKIAADRQFGGPMLRKAIDYFCHVAVAPEFVQKIKVGDPEFAASEYFNRMAWLANATDDIYDPTYTDMLRVAFTSEFHRGRLQDLVALLSGRNFETRQYEEEIAERSFMQLKRGILNFMNQTDFNHFTMILRDAGFVTNDLISNKNAVNFAYIVYLRGRAEQAPRHLLESLVRRWYVMTVLRQRYTGSIETAFDSDIRQIESHGLLTYTESMLHSELSDGFWTGVLPQLLETSSTISPYFLAFKAAQVRLQNRAFLSASFDVRNLVLHKGDVHHVFPRSMLKKEGLSRGRYNQIANFVLAQDYINRAIGDKAPTTYFGELRDQCNGGLQKYGNIDSLADLRTNLAENALPESLLDETPPAYDEFLAQRRELMALHIKKWFETL